MPTVVGVAFKPVTKIYYFDPAEVENLTVGENVVVETSRGRTLGQIVTGPQEVPDSDITSALKPVVRRATAWDMVQSDQMLHREAEALQTAKQRAAALGMIIKISQVEFSFDGSSAVVYFTSEQRVDFRNLVHELSQAFRTRVEMRQVGVRDEAKFIGGYGKCGRELCCASWLREFAPVSIKMAKTQDLPLNAPEVSGVCGRLLCCLAYENDFYAEARKQMPRVNSMVETPQGIGKVRQVHVLANSITVLVEGPNETRLMVDMPVPEPAFSLAGRARPAEPAGGAEDELDVEQAGEQGAATRAEAALPVGETDASAPPGDDLEEGAAEPREGRPGQSRRSRSRRKKRV